MFDDSSICETVYANPEWKSQRVMVCLKQNLGKIFLDVRKYVKTVDGRMLRQRSRSKGVMLQVHDWKNVMDIMEKMIADNGLIKNKTESSISLSG